RFERSPVHQSEEKQVAAIGANRGLEDRRRVGTACRTGAGLHRGRNLEASAENRGRTGKRAPGGVPRSGGVGLRHCRKRGGKVGASCPGSLRCSPGARTSPSEQSHRRRSGSQGSFARQCESARIARTSREKGSLLPALFIVSQVVVDPRESDGLVPSETLPGLAVKIERA